MTDAEIVRACAERVMGWRAVSPDEGVPAEWERQDGSYTWDWHPLCNERDCWELVDKLVPNHYSIEIHHLGPNVGTWQVHFPNAVRHTTVDPDRRRAIVLACLRAVGVEIA